MGNIQSFSKVSYGSVQDIVMKNTNALLVCTLDKKNEQYAIEKTIAIENEENVINNMMKKRQHDLIIVIYGENMYDDTVIKKYTQLKKNRF